MRANKVFKNDQQLEAYLAHAIEVNKGIDNVVQKLKTMTMHDAVRIATREVLSWIMLDKVFHAAGRYLNFIKNDVMIAKTLIQEGAAEVANTAREAVKAGELAEVAIAGTDIKVAQGATAEFMEQAGNKVGSAVGKVEVEVASELAQAGKVCREVQLTAESVKLVESAIAKLDASVGNLEVLQKAADVLKDVPGAFGKDGVFTKVIECGSVADKLGTARGAAYEIEKAYELMRRGKVITRIGEKIEGILNNNKFRIEFDIATSDTLIECKNIDWSKVKELDGLRGQFGKQYKVATEIAKKGYELHSKNPIPESLKEWLTKKGIKFFEG